MAGWGGPRAGAGWGGPAKGASKAARLKPAGDPESDALRAKRWDRGIMERKEEIAEEMRRVLYTVATEAPETMARINAADKLLDRIEGKPLARQQISGEGGAGLVINVVKRGVD